VTSGSRSRPPESARLGASHKAALCEAARMPGLGAMGMMTV